MGESSLPFDAGWLRSLLLITFASIACWTDLTDRRIPNTLCGVALAVGLSFFFLEGGLRGLISSLLGVVCAGGVFLIFYALGGFGAGDVKLIGSLGSLVGFRLSFRFIVYVALAGGVLGVLVLIRHRALGKGLMKSFRRIFHPLEEVTPPEETPGVGDVDAEGIPRSVPYGVAVLAGVLMLYLEGSL